ncbi:MAG: SDR family oxidoreductase [Microbacterium sp.]|uniref:SDR family NAD(P)-dependent oxidoreductase n=1 Tax=Microbacterium sp. TaxID=51671 RepID=UPI0039E33E0F
MTETRSVAVVTGSGSGLGRALAARFIAGGNRVVGLDIRVGEPLDGLTEIATDITDPAAVSAAFQHAAALGPLEVLVNAAGVYPRSTLADATADLYRRIFDVNVLGTVLPTQAFVAARDDAKRGCVVNVASVDGIAATGISVLYSASKAAVVNLTQGIAGELAEKNVRVFAIAPDYIATETVIELVGGAIPDNAATPQQVADTCWDLSRTDAFALVTGQTLVLRKGALDV